jgi:type II secretion system protein N
VIQNPLVEAAVTTLKDRLAGLSRFSKYAGPIGYPLLYGVCLIVFALLTFPYGKLKERIVASFNAEQPPNGGQELQIDDMSGYWLTGVSLKGVTLLRASAEPGHPPSRIVIDEATARYSILSAIVGNSSLSFSATAFGGEVSGSYDVHSKGKSVELTLDSIDMARIQPIADTLGVPIQGKLGGSVRLNFPDGKGAKAGGSVAFEAQDVSVGDGKAKIKDTLALPKVDVGALTFTAEAKDGMLRVTKFAAGGRDVDFLGDGRILLRDQTSDSILELQVRFRINDVYRNKSDITKSLFGAPGSNIPALFEMADPKIKQSKRPDGFYGWNIRGVLSRPDFQPTPGGAAGGK